MDKRALKFTVELSVIPLVLMVLYVWAVDLNWQLSGVSAITIFPLLGLLAFVIMWWHFLLGFMKDIDPRFERFKTLYKTSSIFVLLLILLHPLLLAFFGISNNIANPPGFYYQYVGETNAIFVTLGVVALVIFLLYDLAKWLKKHDFVNNNWDIIDTIDDIAFIMVFAHSLVLGHHVQAGWFGMIWLALGISGFVFIGFKHWRKITDRNEA